MSKETVLIKDMWWDGNDFHTIDVHGKHTIYKEAYYTGFSIEEDDNVIKAKDVVHITKDITYG